MAYNKIYFRSKTPPAFMSVKGRSKAARLAAGMNRDALRRRGAQEAATSAAPAPERERHAHAGAHGAVAREELEKLRIERDEYLELARRERAEFDNYRKRAARDLKNLKRESLASFLKEFFGPLDDIDRVLAESEKKHSYETLIEGVKILSGNLRKVLEKAGVRQMEAKGEKFNPEFHEAMAAVPAPGTPANTVLEVYENGYVLDDFVLKPARVVVSREE
jgi:molecular chaperone GrpE